MSAVAITSIHAMPRGANTLERATIRLASAVTRWVTQRAERRQDQQERMLRGIQDQQTRRADGRAAEHLLAQMGLPRR